MEEYKYKYTPDYGRHRTDQFLVVKPDLEAEDNQLFINVTMDGAIPGDAWVSVMGVEEIRKFVYASAVHGGLIEEGDDLTFRVVDGQLIQTGVDHGDS